MKALLVTLALLALAASAASTITSGGCGACQTPHPTPPPITLPPPVILPPPITLPPPVVLPPQPHPCPCQQPTYPSPCQYPGHCGGVGTPTPPPMLGQCIEFLRQQCSPAATPYCSPQCNAMRQQCCQQIRHVEPLHRYQVIFSAVLQQQPQGHPLATLMAAQVAQQLMQMCGIQLQQPSPCASCSAPAGIVHH